MSRRIDPFLRSPLRRAAARLAVAALAPLALSGVSAAAPMPPAAAPAPNAEGLALLAAIDVPLSAELIARTGLTEAAATAALADLSAKRYVRLRAVGALPFFGTTTARALVERTAAADADEVVRIQAVTSLARGFGGRDRPGVSATLRALAHDATPPVAEAIAAELALLASAPEAPASPPLGGPGAR